MRILLVTLLALSACVNRAAENSTERSPSPTSPDTTASALGGESLEWKTFEPSPTERTEATAASVGGLIMLAGGMSPNNGALKTVEIFLATSHPESPGELKFPGGKWVSYPDLPIGVNHAMLAADRVSGTYYLFGGYRGPGLSNPSNRAFQLLIADGCELTSGKCGTWREIQRMPEPRGAGGAAFLEEDGAFYVAGGVGPDGLASSTMVYDPEGDEWSTVEGLPTPREHLGVAAHEGKLYLVGGRTGGIGTNLDAAEVYDPSKNEWTKLPPMPTARGGIAAAASENGYIVAVGGEAQSTFDEAEAFETLEGKWLSLPRMPTARHGLGVASFNNTIYVLTGGRTPGGSYSDLNEAIDLSSLRSK